MTPPVIIGSRGSDLALWQAHRVQALLSQSTGAVTEIRIISTKGDRIDTLPFDKLEGKGFFTKEIEEALLSGEIDLAVHSLKDLPTECPPDLEVAAILERADTRELLLVSPEAYDPTRDPLPIRSGARVGTSAARRQAQLAEIAPDLNVEPLRGNVPTRVRKLREGQFDAILLALAGVERLGLDLSDLVRIPVRPDIFIPAPGQGALAIEIRAADEATRALVMTLHDTETAADVNAERGLLTRFGGGCSLPLGAAIQRFGPHLVMHAFWDPGHGARAVRVARQGTDATALGQAVYEDLVGSKPGGSPLAGVRVVVTRPAADDDPLPRHLAGLGAEVVSFPVLRIAPYAAPKSGPEALRATADADWLLFPSASAVDHFEARLQVAQLDFPANVKIGAVGPGTARALQDHGREVDLVPATYTSAALLEALLDACGEPQRFLIPCAREGRDVLPQGLSDAGHTVVRLPIYETVANDGTLDPKIIAGSHYVLFASPSAVHHFLARTSVPEGTRVVTIGPVTSEAVRERGLSVHAEAVPHTVEGLVGCLMTE